MHFRKNRAIQTSNLFKIGENIIETVDRYKYLEVIFHDKTCFSFHCDYLAKGAGPALGKLVSKIHNFKDFGFKSYNKLFESRVVPILDYCASVLGFKHYQTIDIV